jgi:hypothetical protein
MLIPGLAIAKISNKNSNESMSANKKSYKNKT